MAILSLSRGRWFDSAMWPALRPWHVSILVPLWYGPVFLTIILSNFYLCTTLKTIKAHGSKTDPWAFIVLTVNENLLNHHFQTVGVGGRDPRSTSQPKKNGPAWVCHWSKVFCFPTEALAIIADSEHSHPWCPIHGLKRADSRQRLMPP